MWSYNPKELDINYLFLFFIIAFLITKLLPEQCSPQNRTFILLFINNYNIFIDFTVSNIGTRIEKNYSPSLTV